MRLVGRKGLATALHGWLVFAELGAALVYFS